MRAAKSIFLGLATIAALAFTLACGDDGDPAADQVAVTRVELDKKSAGLALGGAPETVVLTATVHPQEATNKNVTWISESIGVATVEPNVPNGLTATVRAVGVGEARITVRTADGNKEDSCLVTVEAATVHVTGISMNKASMRLAQGASGNLEVIFAPANATDKSVTWISSAPAVATVDQLGPGSALVTAVVAVGSTVITATSADGGLTARCAVTVSPVTMPHATISGGFCQTLAIKDDGSLWAWGGNQSGTIGIGNTANPLPDPVQVGQDTDWVSVAAGGLHSLAIKSDGSLWAWGGNESGQVGNGTWTNQLSPVQVGTDRDWAAVTAGPDHTAALKDDGSLWAWGWNDYGTLGDGSTTNRNAPVQVGTDRDWAYVSAGGAHTVAFKSDGSLWSWGRNGYGQLGLGYSSWWEDKTTPASVSAEGGWVSVSAATFRTMALKDDGSVWAWGWNETWGLGNDSEAQQNSPVQVGSAKDWVAVRAAGNSYHNIALKGDGGLWTWGDNWQGQLGSGVFEEHAYVPARVGYAENWAAVAPGFYHSMALQSDGSLWTWGHNWFGQLGDGHYGMYAEDWRCEPYWVGAGFRLPD